MRGKLIEFLSSFITDKRLETFNYVLENRTKYITVILEDIYQSQNASAVLRTCDCFGIQDLHIIENYNKFNVNPRVALGSTNWLDIYNYNSLPSNTSEALKSIKEKGYRIIATSQNKDCLSIDEFDLNKGKVAFVFGNEHRGISEEVKKLADEFVTIPMFGFTESFNISASVSMILFNTILKLRKSEINWKLKDDEIIDLKLKWLKQTIKKSDLLVKKFEELKAL